MAENQKAIELLEKIKMRRQSHCGQLWGEINEVIALLKCPTCGGSEQVGEEQFYYGRSVGWKECPDCADKPKSQEPAKPVSELIERIRVNFEPTKFGPKGFPQINFREMIKPDVLEACDRLVAETEISQKSLEACVLANMEIKQLQERNDNQREQIVKFIKENGELQAKLEALKE